MQPRLLVAGSGPVDSPSSYSDWILRYPPWFYLVALQQCQIFSFIDFFH
jgi:hypothetical protein